MILFPNMLNQECRIREHKTQDVMMKELINTFVKSINSTSYISVEQGGTVINCLCTSVSPNPYSNCTITLASSPFTSVATALSNPTVTCSASEAQMKFKE
jgi:hypothetical protein